MHVCLWLGFGPNGRLNCLPEQFVPLPLNTLMSIVLSCPSSENNHLCWADTETTLVEESNIE